jgi:hypothetical protein
MPLRKLAAMLLGDLFLAAVSPARADEWSGARSTGRGGVGLADGSDVGDIARNVAAVSLAARYDLAAGGGAGPDDTWLGRVAAADSRTSVVTLGAAYSYKLDDVEPPSRALPGWVLADDEITNVTSHQGLSVGIAYPFLNRRVAIAATGRYDWRDSEQEGQEDGFNFGISAAGKPWEPVTVSVAINNALDLGYPDTRRTVDVGARWEPGPYLGFETVLRTEWMGDPFEESLAEHVGIDVGVTKWLRLAAGWQQEDGAHRVGGGLSLVSDKADLDYSLVGELESDPARLWHGLDLRVHF